MFIRFNERMRLHGQHHAILNMDTLIEVYVKVLMYEGKDEKDVIQYGPPMYLVKSERGAPKDFDCLDYSTNYGDKEVYRHPDFPGFNDNLTENMTGFNGQKVGSAYGHVWLLETEVEEITDDNNATYKFLLKK